MKYHRRNLLNELSGEEKLIIEQAKSDGSFMKAPNGERSMLSEKQWARVRTPAFKEWFGDWIIFAKSAQFLSLLQTIPLKYLDKNGEPQASFVTQFDNLIHAK